MAIQTTPRIRKRNVRFISPLLMNQNSCGRNWLFASRLQTMQNLADFFLMLFFFLRRHPVSQDNDFVFNRHERNADRTRPVLIFAAENELLNFFAIEFKLVLLLGGLIQLDLVFLEKIKRVVQLRVHSFLAANRYRGQINGRIRTLSGNAVVDFLWFPTLREINRCDGKFVARQLESFSERGMGEEN